MCLYLWGCVPCQMPEGTLLAVASTPMTTLTTTALAMEMLQGILPLLDLASISMTMFDSDYKILWAIYDQFVLICAGDFRVVACLTCDHAVHQ